MKTNFFVSCGFVLSVLFLCPFTISAQCLTGDCENGMGTKLYKQNLYIGNFANGMPNGEGKFGSIKDNTLTLDSIEFAGFFIDGVLTKGTQTIVSRWKLTDSKNIPVGTPQKKIDKLFYQPDNNVLAIKKEYPVEYRSKKDIYYRFYYVDGSNLDWTGRIKKEAFHGKGKLNFYDSDAEIEFDAGKLIGVVKFHKTNYNNTLNGLSYDKITVTNGMVNGFKMYNYTTSDSLTAIVESPISYFKFATIPIATGSFKVKYKNGDLYSGLLLKNKFDGFGEIIYADSTTFKGYFSNGFIHGNAIKNNNRGSIDSGLFLFNKFTKGICSRPSKADFSFPICESGNCNNGFGKARYRTIPSDTLKDYYEGNFVNGIPNGSGTTYFRNGDFVLEKKGIFSSGILSGDCIITANKGLLRKMQGNFTDDFMISGRVDYSDGSTFEFGLVNDKNIYRLIQRKLRYSWLKEKFVPDEGVYYLPSGSKVTGTFNDLGGLVEGLYENPEGIHLNMGHTYDRNFTSIGILERPYLENLDIIATKYVAIIKQQAADAERYRLAYAAAKKEQERVAAINDANTRNKANYKNVSGYEKCGNCDGIGSFTYTNTFGRVIEKVDVNNKSEVGSVVKSGRTYTNKVTCSVCGGAGRLYVTKEVYIGPALQK